MREHIIRLQLFFQLVAQGSNGITFHVIYSKKVVFSVSDRQLGRKKSECSSQETTIVKVTSPDALPLSYKSLNSES